MVFCFIKVKLLINGCNNHNALSMDGQKTQMITRDTTRHYDFRDSYITTVISNWCYMLNSGKENIHIPADVTSCLHSMSNRWRPGEHYIKGIETWPENIDYTVGQCHWITTRRDKKTTNLTSTTLQKPIQKSQLFHMRIVLMKEILKLTTMTETKHIYSVRKMSPKAPGTNKEPSLINVVLICCNNYPDSLTAYQGSGLAYYTYTSSCHRCDSNCTRNSCSKLPYSKVSVC